MKDIFSAFFYEDEKIELNWNSEKTLFVFDTNVLLNTYSLNEDNLNFFMEMLENLKDQAWIPYHVGLEFNLNRANTVLNQYKNTSGLKKEISELEKIFSPDLKKIDSLLEAGRIPN